MKYYPAFMSLLSKECRLVKNTNSQRFFMVKEPDQYPGFAKIANCDSQMNEINNSRVTKQEYESNWQVIK